MICQSSSAQTLKMRGEDKAKALLAMPGLQDGTHFLSLKSGMVTFGHFNTNISEG